MARQPSLAGWADPALFSLCAGLLLGAAEHFRTRPSVVAVSQPSSYLPAAAPTSPSRAHRVIDAPPQRHHRPLRGFAQLFAYCEHLPPKNGVALLHAFTLVDSIACPSRQRRGICRRCRDMTWQATPQEVAQALRAAASILAEVRHPARAAADGTGTARHRHRYRNRQRPGRLSPARRRRHGAGQDCHHRRPPVAHRELAEPIIRPRCCRHCRCRFAERRWSCSRILPKACIAQYSHSAPGQSGQRIGIMKPHTPFAIMQPFNARRRPEENTEFRIGIATYPGLATPPSLRAAGEAIPDCRGPLGLAMTDCPGCRGPLGLAMTDCADCRGPLGLAMTSTSHFSVIASRRRSNPCRHREEWSGEAMPGWTDLSRGS